MGRVLNFRRNNNIVGSLGSLTVTGQEPWLSAGSVVTKRAPNCSSASCYAVFMKNIGKKILVKTGIWREIRSGIMYKIIGIILMARNN